MSYSAKNKRKGTLQITDLKCKNGCGYFGNPEWQGYCSKCHRELNQKKDEHVSKKSSKKVQRSYSDAHESSLSLGFSKFEEKKKQQTEKRANTLKTIMKRGHTLKESSSILSPSKDVFLVGDSFSREMQVKDSVMKDVLKNMKQQMEIMQKYCEKSIDEQSEVMQDFYNFMFNRAETHGAYQDLSSEQVDLLMDKIEEQLMCHMHRNIIHQITSEYEEKDLALQKRIRSLNWITPLHLGLDIKESSPEVRDLVDKAITDVIEMDAKIAPQEKISCIVNCSKSIFNIINLCQGVTASADEFLPTMVYIVLKANPPLLQSNIKYITSYSIPARLRSGEGAYYFTNLCCAVAFIDNLTAESLSMSEEEFRRYMSGEMPLCTTEPDATASEGLRLMSQNLISLLTIQDKSDQVMKELLILKDDVVKFEESLQKCKSTPPLVINPTPYIVPANVDMSLIPEVLRNRVVRAPLEAVLVDIDSQTDASIAKETSLGNATEHSNESDFTKTSTEEPTKTFTAPDIFSAMQPMLQVSLPPTNLNLQNCTAPTSPLQPLQVNSSFTPKYVNIQDLEYPTDVFPENKNEAPGVEFGPFESCDTAETGDSIVKVDSSQSSIDPLSPGANFSEQNFQLPPPLQPVVVRNVNLESHD